MRMLSWSLAVLISFVYLFSNAQNSHEVVPQGFAQSFYKSKTHVFEFKDSKGERVQVSTAKIFVPRKEIHQIFDSLPNSKTVLFSYYESQLDDVIQNNSKSFTRPKKTFFLPKPASELVDRASRQIQRAASDDKMGLLIVTVNTAYDSFLWMDASNLSFEQRSTMVLFNVVLAAAFGLDKDLWSRMTQPLENRVSALLTRFSIQSDQVKLVASTFAASLAFSFAIQTLRVSILSYPELLDAVTSARFWGTNILMGSLLTLSTFGWSEQLAAVDQVKNPVAKAALRRYMEIRSSVMGSLAPSSKLLQPDVYGITPILATVVHGTLGIWMMLNSEKVVNWIESKSFIKSAYRLHRNAELWVAESFDRAQTSLQSCRTFF